MLTPWTIAELSRPGALSVPKLIAFDLDDTLAESKSPVQPEIYVLLSDLLDRAAVCIISGARFEQFETQLLAPAGDRLRRRDRLHIMPTCGTRYYRHPGDSWECVYAEDLTDEEKARVIRVLQDGAGELGLRETSTWGDVIEDRGSQITFSALGQQAPVHAKSRWDPDGSKRDRLRAYAQPLLPDLEVRSGGSTSIDVTRKGIDKAHGIRTLAETLAIPFGSMLFVGDRLQPGGNDYPVLALGVPSVETSGPDQTATLIRIVLAILDSPADR